MHQMQWHIWVIATGENSKSEIKQHIIYTKNPISVEVLIVTLLPNKVKSYAMPKLKKHRPRHQILCYVSYKLLWYYGINFNKQKSDEVNSLFNSVIGWTRISRIQGVIGRNSVNMGTVYVVRPRSIARSPGGQGSYRQKRPQGPYYERLGIKIGI